MSLQDRLTEDLKLAMKSRDQLRMDVIRMVKAAITNKEMELKKDLDDADMSKIMTTLIKQRRESIVQYEKGGRADLAAVEQAELAILAAYLPAIAERGLVDLEVTWFVKNKQKENEIIDHGDDILPSLVNLQKTANMIRGINQRN